MSVSWKMWVEEVVENNESFVELYKYKTAV